MTSTDISWSPDVGPSRAALSDILAGWKRRSMWWALAVQDTRTLYKRTALGPFWISVQMLTWVLGIALVYGAIFGVSARDYIPFVGCGVLLWGLLSGLIVSAADAFTGARSFIQSAALPLSFYCYRTVARQLLIFLHSAAVMALVLLAMGVDSASTVFVTTPTVVTLILVNGFFLSLWFGAACARFRDLKALINSVIQFLMFLTPIFWDPDRLTNRYWIVVGNPLAWFVEAFRRPILGDPVPAWIWAAIGILTLVNGLMALLLFGRAKRGIAYWV